MADEQRLDEVARLLADNQDVGRVIGARPSEDMSCDVELVMLSRVDDAYRLRTAIVGLDRLREVRDDLFTYPRLDTFAAEDVTYPKLEDALRSAQALAAASRAEPVPDLARWVGSDAFREGLKRSRLMSQNPRVPQLPRWFFIVKGVLIGAFVVAFLVLPTVPIWAVIDPMVGGVWDDWWAIILAIVLFLAVGFGLIGLAHVAEGVLDRVERRLERYRDGPGDSTNRPSSAAPPESFMVHGTGRVGYLIGAVAWVLTVAWSMTWPEEAWGGEPPPRIRPLVGVLVLASLLAAFRAYRRGVGAGPAGVIVVNFGHTHRIRWQDLRGISYWDREFTFGVESVYALEFLLSSGVTVPATIPSGDGKPGGRLDLLRDRIVAVGEAALPGQLEARASGCKARVNSVRRRRLESAAVDVAIIIGLPDDRCRYRRVRCSGSDLKGGMAHLFDPDPDRLVRGGDPSAPRGVLDRDFGTREDALRAVSRDVLAPSTGWLDEVEFCSWVHGSEFADRVRPEADRVRVWERVVLGVVAVAVFVAAMYVGNLFDVWVGLDTPQTSGSTADGAYTFVLVVAAAALAAWVTVRSGRVVSRHNLATEMAREQKRRGGTASHTARQDDALGTASAALADEPPTSPDAQVDQDEAGGEADRDGSGPEDADLEVLEVVICLTVWIAVVVAVLMAALSEPPGSMAGYVYLVVALVFFVSILWLGRFGALLERISRPVRLRAEPPTMLRYASLDVVENGDATLVPKLLRVRARTRNVSLAGWLFCAVLQVAAAVVAQKMGGEVWLTAACLATGGVLAAVGVRGFQRRLVADTTGIVIHNFLRRVSIPWAEVRSIDFVAVNAVAADIAPVDAAPVVAVTGDTVRVPAGPHKLRFNERVTAEVPAGGSGPGEYLFTLRGTLWSMQRTYSPDGGSLPAEPESAYHWQEVQADSHPRDVQDTHPDPEA